MKMKICYSMTFAVAVTISLLFVCTFVLGDVGPTVDYDPSQLFTSQNGNSYVWHSNLPAVRVDKTKFNAFVRFSYEWAIDDRDYPATTAMIKGICDTFQIKVQFLNKTDSNIVLTGENPHDWFAPRLYKTTMNIVEDAPVLDSTELSYSVQACVDSLDPFNPPDTILAGNQSHVIAYNVWGVPEGVWVLTLGKTNKTPSYLNVLYDGGVFEYRYAEDAQDTVNAWLALAERQRECRDYDGALDWIEKVIADYPHSVPGWWSKASLHSWHGDSLLTFQAYDSAFAFFDALSDPLLPDTTGSVHPVERLYMRAVRPLMEFDRYGAEQYGFWK